MNIQQRLSSKGRWAVCSKRALKTLVGSAWSHVGKRKLDLGVVHHLDRCTLGLRRLQGASLDDLNRRLSCTVATAHVSIHLLNGTAESGVTELLVHVVGA